MDAFFAAIEQLDRPELRGKPILVGSDRPRGVVTTASYEARPFGCHSAQPMAVARRLCPHAIVVPVRGARYREVSQRVFAIFDEFSPLVEPLSIDEAFLDATGTQRLFGSAPVLARQLKQRIQRELHLTASVGIAPNKFLAKLGSDEQKPDGLTVITQRQIDTWLPALPIGRMWGIGPATAAKLERRGLRTFADLQALSLEQMQQTFGSDAEHYSRLCRGIDDRPVTPDSQAKSIGHEQTFETDIPDADEVRRVLLDQVDQVARRLRRHRLLARGLTLKIRYGEFETISRSATLDEPTDVTDRLWSAAATLFDRWASRSFQPVRLIGVSANRLKQTAEQLELFDDPQRRRQQRLDQATDRIVQRFGKGALRRGDAIR